MKNIFNKSLLIFLGIILFTSCTTTRFYLVRHADRLNNSADSPLSPDGIIRANTLADTLRNKNISRIFVSIRQRTQQTAAPTSTHFNISPTIFSNDSTQALIRSLKNINNKNVLVVWHSENVHTVVNSLVPVSLSIQPIENVFNNLFVIEKRIILWQKKTTLSKLKYGVER